MNLAPYNNRHNINERVVNIALNLETTRYQKQITVCGLIEPGIQI